MQLRQENLAHSYNLVLFQIICVSRADILRLIPGLGRCSFSVTALIGVSTLTAPALSSHNRCNCGSIRTFFAGQISGVARICGVDRADSWRTQLAGGAGAGRSGERVPRETAIVPLCHYISHADRGIISRRMSPSTCFRRSTDPRDRKERQTAICARALEKLDQYAGVHV